MQDNYVSAAEIEALYQKLSKDAHAGGYFLNPDIDFAKDLIKGLIINERRYGYQACPCRLASGQKPEDLDIICPCNYRDEDVAEFGACYCALYVSQKASAGEQPIHSIPERRPPVELRKQASRAAELAGRNPWSLPLPVWRCQVCGYLAARESPPDICPICKAKRDRFERFI